MADGRGRTPESADSAFLAGVVEEVDDLVLPGDCCYLPYEEGPLGMARFESARILLAAIRIKEADPRALVRSDDHPPGTYRGGMVARLQRLLQPQPDGTFSPTLDEGAAADEPALHEAKR